MYDPALLQAIGMDVEFTSFWKAIGWKEVDPLWEQGSHLLNIQFLCSLKYVDNGITFCLFEVEHFCTWKDLAKHIGFQRRCLIDLDHALRGFNRHKFWNEILGQTVDGKFQPRNMDIQHPTLRLMHHWIAMTLFSRQDIRVVHNTEMQILYAMIKKIKIAPVKEIFKHWLDTLKLFSTSISCTSLVTRTATSVGAMEDRDVVYILTSRIIINEHYLLQGHHLKHNASGQLVFFF